MCVARSARDLKQGVAKHVLRGKKNKWLFRIFSDLDWLVGFTEAEGSFYLVSKEPTRIVHAFEITQKLDIIVLKAIAHILGISTCAEAEQWKNL